MGASNPPVGQRGRMDMLGVGVDVRSIEKNTGNSWAMNVLFRDGRCEVRPGFGTLARLSTTLNAGRDSTQQYGYTGHLGSHYMVTDQGHEQLLSVLTVSGWSTDSRLDSQNAWVDPLCQLAKTVALSVFDLTTGRRSELMFLVKTAELVADSGDDITRLYPHGQTNSQQDRQRLVMAQPSRCSFQQMGDVCYIVVQDLGVYAYRPIDPTCRFSNQQDRKAQSVNRSWWQGGGEQSALSKMLPANGPFVESYAYVRPAEWAPPTCAAVCQGRMVYAQGRTLWFSDPDLPNHLITDNVYVVTSDNPITALRATADRLYIFTRDQVFLYQPSFQDALASGGRLIELSRGEGAISQNHTCVAGDFVVFVDAGGVKAVSGTSIKPLSEEIVSWFNTKQGVQNPLSSYKVASGLTALTGEQPRARISLVDQMDSCNVTWHDFTATLYCTFQDVTLVWCQRSGWSIWLYETTAVQQVGLTRQIERPWLLAGGNELYMVDGPHGTDYQGIGDQHYQVLQLGRGGALDCSSAAQEDHRAPSAGWQRRNGLSGAGAVYCGRLEKMPKPFRTARATYTDQIYLMPVYVESGLVTLTAGWKLRATYDYVNWQIATFGPAGEVDFLVPAERLASESAYRRGAMDATHQVRLFNTFTGLADNQGNELRIDMDGAGGPWTWAPDLNIAQGRPTPMLYVPVYRRTATTRLNMLLSPSVAQLHDQFGVVQAAKAYVWNEARDFPEQSLADDAMAQPVDWAVQSRHIGTEEADQVKMRGIRARVLSHGAATLRDPNWRYGPLNLTVASDFRDLGGQQIDWQGAVPGIVEDVNIVSIRSRLQQLTVPISALSLKVGNAVARWSSTVAPQTGNLLIDDPVVNTIATSNSCRGEQFAVMLFGTMADPGERIELASVEGEYVVVGGRRRTGR